MRKQYLKPVMQIIMVSKQDIMTASTYDVWKDDQIWSD